MLELLYQNVEVDDNLYAQFKIAQKVHNKEMTAKERLLSSLQAKHVIFDITSPGKRTVTESAKVQFG